MADGWGKASDALKAGKEIHSQKRSDGRSAQNQDYLKIHQIKPRPHGDTRELKIPKIIEFAQSISFIGLLSGVSVDVKNCLIAGKHRLTVFELLNLDAVARGKRFLALCEKVKYEPSKSQISAVFNLDVSVFLKRYPNGTIPVTPHPDIDAKRDPDAARAAEISENEKRGDYTKEDIVEMKKSLLKDPYVKDIKDLKGRPKPGQKGINEEIASRFGLSIQRVKNILSEDRKRSVPPGTLLDKDSEDRAVIPKIRKKLEDSIHLISTAGHPRKMVNIRKSLESQLLELDELLSKLGGNTNE